VNKPGRNISSALPPAASADSELIYWLVAPGLGYTGQHLSWNQLIFRCQIIFKTETSFKVEKVPLWKTNSGQAEAPGFSLTINVPVEREDKGKVSHAGVGGGSTCGGSVFT
jgi:hypothetical protein